MKARVFILFLCMIIHYAYSAADSLTVYWCYRDTCSLAPQQAVHSITRDSVIVKYRYYNVYKIPGNLGFNFIPSHIKIDSVKKSNACTEYYGYDCYSDRRTVYRKCSDFIMLYSNMSTGDGVLFSVCKTDNVDFDGRRVTCLE